MATSAAQTVKSNPNSPKQNPTLTDKPTAVKKKHFNSFGPYKLGKTIGQGEFGKVKIGYHLKSGNQVAIKLIKKESVIQASRKQKLVREIEILQSVNHRHIVKLWEVIETDNYIGMVMNYAEGGELFDHILTRRYLKDGEACRLFAQLILGISYLHGHGIVHRDLKLENLLLDKDRNLVIIDFGFANRFNRKSREGDLLSTSCGSACYAAPELVISDKYSAEGADIWSCGVILYAMVCGYLPYDDDPSNADGKNIQKLYKYIMEKRLEFPAHVSLPAQHLILRILVTDPEKRAKINEIQSHRWLSEYKNDFSQQQEGLNLSMGKNKGTLPETRTEILPENKKASNPLLSSIQELPDTKIPETEPDTILYAIQSVISSAGLGETPVSGDQVANPPSLPIPQSPSTPAPPSISNFDQDKKETVPSVTEIKEQIIAVRKSIDATQNHQKSRSQIEKKDDEDISRAVSMDQHRTGIIGITDGLEEEFKKLKEKHGNGITEKHATISRKEKEKEKTTQDNSTPSQRNKETSIYFLKYHSGPIDRRALTSKSPNYILKRLIEKLKEMGFQLFFDPQDPFIIKAVQIQNADGSSIKTPGKKSSSMTGLFERMKYIGQFGLQYNRGYSGAPLPLPPPTRKEVQQLDPIKMHVMIHQIKNLEGILTVDVKRTRGDIWEFKRVYEELIKKLKLTIA